MKVVAVNGSPKSNGNTAQAIDVAAKELEARGIETEILTIGIQPVRGCIGCGACGRNKNGRCVFDDDITNGFIEKMRGADGILLGSPTHYAGITGSMKSFLDRAFFVGGANGGLFRHKVGASLAAVRRSGGITALDQLNKYLFYSEMLIASSNYWNVIHGRVPGEVKEDAEGNQIPRLLGRNMAWLLQLREAGEGIVQEPQPEAKEFTSFVR